MRFFASEIRACSARGWMRFSEMCRSRSAPLSAATWSEESQIENRPGNPMRVPCARNARRQNAWKVPMVSSAAFFFPTSEATRSFISPAALFVNVTARTRSAGTPLRSRCAMRFVMTEVLPVPAPARTRTGPSVVSTAFFCWALRRKGRGG